jgi:hypothetical protein
VGVNGHSRLRREAQLKKTQAEPEEASGAQLRHMEGGKEAKAADRTDRIERTT